MHRFGARLAAALAVAAMMVAGLLLVPVDAATVVLCQGVTNAEVKKCDAGYSAAMNTMHWRMYAGHNCTNYVAYQLGQNGVPEPKTLMGNAVSWAGNAKKLGYKVDSKPAVGAVGAWPGKNHVVYVAEVGPGYLVTREDNYPGYYPKGLYQTLRVYPGSSAYPTQFIHFDDRTSLATPTGLAVTAQTATSLSLAWDAVPAAPGYRVQISKNANMSGAKYWGFTNAAGTITGLDPETQYYFRVVVVDADNVDKLTDYTGTPYPSASTLQQPLTIPTNLRSTAQDESTLTLAWDAVPRAPRYRIQYSTSPTMSGAKYTSFTTNSGVLKGLAAKTRYYFRVVVVDADDKAKLTDYTQDPYPSAMTTDGSPNATLTIPKNLKSTAQTSDSLTLGWDAVPGAPRYRVQLSKNANMSGAVYHSFTTNKAVLTGLSPETTYYFRVVVVDADDKAKLTDYTQKPYPSASTTAKVPEPTIPTNLRSTSQERTSLALAWDAVPGAPRYRIQYSTSPTMSGAKYTSFTTNSGILTGLSPVTMYYFRVVVVDADDEAKLTDYTQKPYPSASTTDVIPPAPGHLRWTAYSATSLTLGWDAAEGAARYRIQYSKNANMSGSSYASFTTNAGVLTGLTPSTKYYFRVVVVDAADKVKLSEYSAQPYASGSTVAVPSTPRNLTSTAQTKDSLTLRWDAVPGAPRYRIQYSTSASMSGAKYTSTPDSSATKVLTGLSAKTTYYFRVVVVDSDDNVKLSDYTQKPYPSASTRAN